MKNLYFDFRLKSIDYQYQNGSGFLFFRLREPNIIKQRYSKIVKQDCFDHDFVIGEISCEVSSYESTYVRIIAWKTESTGYGKLFNFYIQTGDLLVLNEEQIHE